MSVNFDPSKSDRDLYFAILERRLMERKLPSAGDPRTVDVDEFMLMHTKTANGQFVVGFKHRDTRNYVFLHRSSDDEDFELHVPLSDRAFNRGIF